MNDLRDAEKMGREAFEAGKPRAPALNQAFLEKHIAGRPAGGWGKGGYKLIKAYLAGWDEANLSADVPGWTDEETKRSNAQETTQRRERERPYQTNRRARYRATS